MNHKPHQWIASIIAFFLITLLYLPMLPTGTAQAEAAPSFLLTANKPVDGKITVTMSGTNMKDLYGYEARFTFDPDLLELVEAKSKLDGFSVSPVIKNKEILIAHTKIGNVKGESGDVTIGTLTFKTKKQGTSTVKWESIKAVDSNLSHQTYSVEKSVSVVVDVPVPFKPGFVDLEGHWAKADIELLASKGIIEGMDEKHFVPEAHVTRAQFAAMISRTLNLNLNLNSTANTKPNPFIDVGPASWYRDVVNSVYSAGIVEGMTATSFAPDKEITREEMAVMIVRAKLNLEDSTLEKSVPTEGLKFDDMNTISDWALKHVQLAFSSGIINGRTDQLFVPRGNATRAEAAVMIRRLLSN
ncbi:S-layer homology domain-containing protein [Paenibacillus eucommiae]|uniref:SLH domain-containing protein n=1 Tax=Paenibacillus eucommiae TaxID=1355755 RepID=A0ABS4J6A3_9BACL|nr:S-layer homology domain-containing protein [Paenibacillus eucommiae]MBP1995379.1 hypothetical protein [Paenibacillus eucommiae]